MLFYHFTLLLNNAQLWNYFSIYYTMNNKRKYITYENNSYTGVFRFFDIDGIDDRHGLNFLFITDNKKYWVYSKTAVVTAKPYNFHLQLFKCNIIIPSF